MKSYDNLIDALNDLKLRGYTIDFNLMQNQIACDQHNLYLEPNEFEIDEAYRFEGMNDPDDSSIIYAISSQHGKKGVLINSYGPNADEVSSEMVLKLHYQNR